MTICVPLSVLHVISGTGVKRYTQRWMAEDIPSGSRFTFLENVELPFGIVGKLKGSVSQNMSKATMGKMLIILESLAET